MRFLGHVVVKFGDLGFVVGLEIGHVGIGGEVRVVRSLTGLMDETPRTGFVLIFTQKRHYHCMALLSRWIVCL